MNPLNSPLEVGIRILILLEELAPDAIDLGRLVLFDHSVIHSADLGGPDSLHPAIPARPGELAVKRELIEKGIQILIRAGLANLLVGTQGIRYQATDEAFAFVRILESNYVERLRERASWVVNQFGNIDDDQLRREVAQVYRHWAEEFEAGRYVPTDERSSM